MASSEGKTLRQILDDVEKQYITRMLERHQGHRGRTADALGIPVRTLRRKIKTYQILLPYQRSPQ
jgi:DNA-binding NtrC family response regulator